MELDGQVAIVTGAGRGIGRATALELARMGADLVVAELDQQNAERTASELRGLGRRAVALPTDVTSRRDLAAMERPQDVANVISLLASPRSDYMTGQALSVAGGLVMHG
jgi:NAD(P)-dependent dehydrogenase (short-subunit alcohol dehydrogenase family)